MTMNSLMLELGIEVEVSYSDTTLEPQEVFIHTKGVPKDLQGWIKAWAIDTYEERRKAGRL